MTSSSVQRLMRAHFETAGYFFESPDQIHRRLRRALGNAQYEAHLDRADAIAAGQLPLRATYESVKTLEVANILMSFQAEAAMQAADAVYRAVRPRLTSGTRVLDLGCWTGALAAFIAANHPDVTVCGVDAQANVIALARQRWRLPNLVFETWDYTAAPPPTIPLSDCLITTFGIDFALEVMTAEVPIAVEWWAMPAASMDDDPRRAPPYEGRRSEAFAYFDRWATAAAPGAQLVAVLRLGSLGRLIATLDAATAAGWRWDPAGSRRFDAEDERFPLLRFSRTPPDVVRLDTADRWWEGSC